MDKLAEILWGADLIIMRRTNTIYRSVVQGIVLNQLQLFAKLLNGACIAYASKDRDINAKHHPWLSHTTANVLKSNSKTMENRRRHIP